MLDPPRIASAQEASSDQSRDKTRLRRSPHCIARQIVQTQRGPRLALPALLDCVRRARSDSPNPESFWRVALSVRPRARAILSMGVF